jgi:hypothetical protein
MFVAPVTKNEVEQVIKGLKNNSSAGYDEIPDIFSETKPMLLHKVIGPHL